MVICPGNLRKIIEYDRTHEGSQLTETLYHYYTCNFNAQKAAEKLFVHRTTFFYRMSKIQKLAAFLGRKGFSFEVISRVLRDVADY